MSETWTSANKRRACLDCGDPGARLWRSEDGRNLRVCDSCMYSGRWDHIRLFTREPILEEVPTEMVEGEWRFPAADGAEPSAVISFTTEPSPETGHVGWLWWALGRMGEATSYEAARKAAEETVQRVIDDRVAVL